MVVNVKFVGSFRSYSGKSGLVLKPRDPVSLSTLVKTIVKKMPRLKSVMLDPELGEPKTNMLVLVNGQEISVLKGFGTIVNDGDEVVFVPVVHGG